MPRGQVITTITFTCPFCGKKHENMKVAIGEENSAYIVGHKRPFKCSKCKAKFFFDYMPFSVQNASFYFENPERFKDVLTVNTNLISGKFLIAEKAER